LAKQADEFNFKVEIARILNRGGILRMTVIS